MSCVVQKVENTARLAEFITMLANSRGKAYSGIVSESLRAAFDVSGVYGDLSAAKVFAALREMNLRAYAGRYRMEYDPVEIEEYAPAGGDNLRPEWDAGEPDGRGNYCRGHWKITPAHFQMYQTAEFYLYQCGEDATDGTPLYKGMEEFVSEFAAFIVHNLPEYVGASWQ